MSDTDARRRTIADMLSDLRPIAGGDGTEDKPDPDDKPGAGNDDDDKKTDDKTVDHKAEADKWKALARKHEAQAKANADKAKKFDEADEASKTEAQKAADRTADAEKRATEAELKALRLEVASDKGLTAAQAKRLIGTTKEELESDADELLESFKADDGGKKAPTGDKPKENLKGGSDPDDTPEEMDPRKLADGITRY